VFLFIGYNLRSELFQTIDVLLNILKTE